ncbi:hypothetical protein LPJ72_005358 [Coemansia sp. Benny D160-2]|nr:hypothetical protein LPJ72_005358 [Coemansia sp. Benny D160-2]
MHSLFRRPLAPRGTANQRNHQRLTWEERARAALAAAREVEESSGESVPTRPSEVNASRRLFYGPRYALPGTHASTSAQAQPERRLQHEKPCAVHQADMSLDVSTLYISSLMVESETSDASASFQSPLFTLTFTVNTLVPISINLYWMATEDWDPPPPENTDGTSRAYPRFTSRVNVSHSYHMESGLGQKFALPKADWLDPGKEPYRTLVSSDSQSRLAPQSKAGHTTTHIHQSTSNLGASVMTSTVQSGFSHESNGIEMSVLQPGETSCSGNLENEIQELTYVDSQKSPAYGLVIELVERQGCMPKTGIAQQNSTPPASQISFINFHKEGTSHLVPRCAKQKLCIDGVLYVQHEIFGLNELFDVQARVDTAESTQCAICLSDERDTVILPCRHLCMCRECANTYRQQSNKCPICRTVVESILHIESRDGS